METYEQHEFRKGLLDKQPEAYRYDIDLLRELAAAQPRVETGQDPHTLMLIEQVERAQRMREREEGRPVEPAPVLSVEPQLKKPKNLIGGKARAKPR